MHTPRLLRFLFGLLGGTALAAPGGGEPAPDAGRRSERYTVEDLRFPSHGIELAARLYLPAGARADAPRPAVAILGPVAFVKEQSPVQYATRLARLGWAALVFDPRYHGASGGEPRRLESGRAKVEDLRAALDFLATRREVDTARLAVLGVCQGANWAAEAATEDARIRSVALVAGHYLVPEVAELYAGGAAGVAARLERARAARERFERDGEVDYIPIVSADDPRALLTFEPIRQWYARWADRGPAWEFHGRWENRIAAMSEADIWGHDVGAVLRRLRTPTLMVHAQHAASGPEAPRRLFTLIPAERKSLEWLGERGQFQFYEEPETIDLATWLVADWFERTSGARR